MNATIKPLTITLNPAEQREYRRFGGDQKTQIGVDPISDIRRRRLLESLEKKGYLEKTGSHFGFVYYKLKGGAL